MLRNLEKNQEKLKGDTEAKERMVVIDEDSGGFRASPRKPTWTCAFKSRGALFQQFLRLKKGVIGWSASDIK